MQYFADHSRPARGLCTFGEKSRAPFLVTHRCHSGRLRGRFSPLRGRSEDGQRTKTEAVGCAHDQIRAMELGGPSATGLLLLIDCEGSRDPAGEIRGAAL